MSCEQADGSGGSCCVSFGSVAGHQRKPRRPHLWRPPGRAAILSIAICVVVDLRGAFAVYSGLRLHRILAATNFAVAEAARPSLGRTSLGLTVALALVANVSSVIASVFGVSRLRAMLTAIALDAAMLGAFAVMDWLSDLPSVAISIVGMALMFRFVRIFLAHDAHQEMA